MGEFGRRCGEPRIVTGGFGNETLLVGDPDPLGGEGRVGGEHDGLAQAVADVGDVGAAGGLGGGVQEETDLPGRAPEGVGERGRVRVQAGAQDGEASGGVGEDDRGGEFARVGDVEEAEGMSRLVVEGVLAPQSPSDLLGGAVEVAEDPVDRDGCAVEIDGEPGAGVHPWPPRTGLADGCRRGAPEAGEIGEVLGQCRAWTCGVVDAEIDVGRRRAGSAGVAATERDAEDAGDCGEVGGHGAHEGTDGRVAHHGSSLPSCPGDAPGRSPRVISGQLVGCQPTTTACNSPTGKSRAAETSTGTVPEYPSADHDTAHCAVAVTV